MDQVKESNYQNYQNKKTMIEEKPRTGRDESFKTKRPTIWYKKRTGNEEYEWLGYDTPSHNAVC